MPPTQRKGAVSTSSSTTGKRTGATLGSGSFPLPCASGVEASGVVVVGDVEDEGISGSGSTYAERRLGWTTQSVGGGKQSAPRHREYAARQSSYMLDETECPVTTSS